VLAGLVMSVNHHVKLGVGDEEQRLISIFNRPAPSVAAMVLVVASGAILAAGQDGGLYLLLPATIVAFVSGMINAWYFLLPPPGGRPSRTARAVARLRHDEPAGPQAGDAPE
jgi:hypothetical protein